MSWRRIEKGLPSVFGFPLAVHPRDPETAFVLPLKGDQFRVPPKASLAVYRTRNGGRSWHRLAKGLPRSGAYFNVLREAMSSDSHDPCGVYFGTTSGTVFASRDEGASWSVLAENLPAICSVTACDA